MTKVTTLAELQRTREIVALSPAGHSYKIRPLNIERHALAGDMPPALRKIAMQGASGVDAVLSGDEAEVLAEHGNELRAYLDRLVLQVLVEPALSADEIDVLPPVDYRWLVQIAMGENDRDGEGRRLWGREPLTTWATFRDEHGCDADCESCDRMRRSVADVQ